METIRIAGQDIEISPLDKSEQSGLWLEIIANFEIGKFTFNSHPLLLLEQKSGEGYTPFQLRKLSERIESTISLPPVFYYSQLPTFMRDRLVEQGVYFLVADKYAFVPTLIINRKEREAKLQSTFSPATQYILLYHLQVESINGKSIKELESLVPYKYKTISKSLSHLNLLGLLSLKGEKEKKIIINVSKKELWEKAQAYLTTPIKSDYYSSKIILEGVIGGISALSHYSMLTPEDVPTRAITSEQFTELRKNVNPLLPFEDLQRIEVWKYPPLSNSGYVDRLSLYLTLKEDKDPRVEKELETMINEMPW